MKNKDYLPETPPPKQEKSLFWFIRYCKRKILRTDSLMAPYMEKKFPKITSIRGKTTHFYQKVAVSTVSLRLIPRVMTSMISAWKDDGQILTSTTLSRDMAVEEWSALYQGYLQRIETDCGMEAFEKLNPTDRVAYMNKYSRREIRTALLVVLVYSIRADILWDTVNFLYKKYK